MAMRVERFSITHDTDTGPIWFALVKNRKLRVNPAPKEAPRTHIRQSPHADASKKEYPNPIKHAAAAKTDPNAPGRDFTTLAYL